MFLRNHLNSAALLVLSALPLSAAIHQRAVKPAAIKSQPQQFFQPAVIPTGSWPAGIESADLNNDGRPDLIYTDYGATATSSTTHILLNNGDGTFTPGQTISTAGASIAIADFDRDGIPDLEWVSSIQGEGRVYFAKGNGDGTFAPTVKLGTFAQIGDLLPHLSYVTAAPMHDGGYLDLLVEDTANSTLFELTADSSGTLVRLFGIHLPDGTGPMTTADLNGDGHTDLIVQGTTAVDVFLGNADGIISTPNSSYTGPNGVSSFLLKDVDADGHPDLILEGTNGHLDILHGYPDGTFSTASEGGTGTLNPATGAGGHLIGLAGAAASIEATQPIYTATAAGISALQLQSSLSITLQGIFNAGSGHSSYVFADFNHDGSPDIAVDSPEGIAILFGNPDGSLQTSRSFSAGQPALSGTLGTFTPSGKLDSVVAVDALHAQLLHGNGDGTFSLLTSPAAAISVHSAGPILTGDFNGDGKLDLALPTTGGLFVQYGNGDGTFGDPVAITTQPGTAIVAKLDASSRASLATTDATGDQVLISQPDGTFSPTTLATATAGLAAAGDLNHDGTTDLLYQNGMQNGMQNGSVWTVYLNSGNASFTPVGTLQNVPTQSNLTATSAVITDLDGDGNGDIIITFDNTFADHAHPTAATPNQIYIWYGHGDGTFSDPVQLTPARNYTQLATVDLNATGRPDLVLSDGYLVGILHNLGQRAFGTEQHLLAGQAINTISSGDLNQDGTLDLVLTNGALRSGVRTASTGGITVLLNSLQPKVVPGIATSVVFTLTTPASLFYGQTVDGYAAVTASDSSLMAGTITFYDGSTSICVIPVTADASCPASAGSGFAAGRHTLTAVYSGDSTHMGSTSNAVTITVQPDPTAATVDSSLNPAPAGQVVTLTATLSASYATPTGTVSFIDGGTTLGTASLNSSGVAALATSALAPGTHSISVAYAATPDFNASTSATLSQVVTATATASPTAVMISSSANPATSGQTVTLTANVVTVNPSKSSPTSTVSFFDGTALLGTAPLNSSGLATITTSTLSVGTHAITASYAGDGVAAPSQSSAFNQVINNPAFPTAVSFIIRVNSTTISTGQTTNLLVRVSPVNGFNQPVQLACANLPAAASCTFAATTIPVGGGATTMKITTKAPGPCGSALSYGQTRTAALPYAGPVLAGMLVFFLPKRRRAMKGLLTLIAMCGFMAMTGCGACTDLGTLPGSYTIQVTGTSLGSSQVTVTQQVQVTVTE